MNEKHIAEEFEVFLKAIDAHFDALKGISLDEARAELARRGIDTAPLEANIRRLHEEVQRAQQTHRQSETASRLLVKHEIAGFQHSSAFFDRLSEWIAACFPALALQATYSDSKTDEVVKEFPSSTGDPYEARLVQDSLGRWFLRVFTKDVEAAKLKLRLEIEPEAPEMQFIAVAPAMFFAEVRLSESMATALKAGHRPVFRASE